MADWQPIATAPRDGTSIIVAVPTEDSDGWIVGEAYFDPKSYVGGDWWWAGTASDDYYAGPIRKTYHWPPTHWMPLPEPPTT